MLLDDRLWDATIAKVCFQEESDPHTVQCHDRVGFHFGYCQSADAGCRVRDFGILTPDPVRNAFAVRCEVHILKISLE